MKWLLIYVGVIVLIWNGFPDNYSTGEKGLVLIPLGFPLVFYFIYKTIGYGPQSRRETMSYDPDGAFQDNKGSGDCDSSGGSDGGCDGGD